MQGESAVRGAGLQSDGVADLRVSHYSTFTQFGASIAARRLHDSLVSMGIESNFYYRWSGGDELGSRYFLYQRRQVRGLLGRLVNRLVRSYSGFVKRVHLGGYDRFRVARLDEITLPVEVGRRHVIHLHWIAEMLDHGSFFDALPTNQPIVWTLHDMNPFTGGCHYAWDCNRHATGCGQCPQLNRFRNPWDLSRLNVIWKKLALARRNVHVVADSFWLESEARRSEVFKNANSFQTIHYGLDVDVFSPQCRATCRGTLAIDPDRFVVCFGAESLNDKRKGVHLLIEALTMLRASGRDVLLLTFGSGAGPDLPFDVCHVGRQSSPQSLARVYSAADVFVIPSVYEAFGQTSLEAMSCGIPVVGFATGGIPDMVEHHRTGLLVERGDIVGLADSLAWLFDHRDEARVLGSNGRAVVLDRFTLKHQAAAYIELYGQLTN